MLKRSKLIKVNHIFPVEEKFCSQKTCESFASNNKTGSKLTAKFLIGGKKSKEKTWRGKKIEKNVRCRRRTEHL